MAGFKLGKKAVKNTELAILGSLTLAACLLGLNEIIVLLAVVYLVVSFICQKTTAEDSVVLSRYF